MSGAGGTAAREEPVTIDGFRHVLPITTRWMDVDVYGHVNNVVYYSYFTYPAPVMAGMRVAKLGSSSVRYQIALFQGDDPSAAAQGHFVHVYVERATQRPVPSPEPVRALLQTRVI